MLADKPTDCGVSEVDLERDRRIEAALALLSAELLPRQQVP